MAFNPRFKTEFQRDGILRVTKVLNEHLVGNQADTNYKNLGSWTYSYDSASNPLDMVHTGAAMDELASSQYYDYDTLNRLLTALVMDTQTWTAASKVTTWFNYDDLGNRISSAERGGTAIGYSHDKANRMTGLSNKTQYYDLAGNLTVAYSEDRASSYKYSYDYNNRLTNVGYITGGSNPSWTTSTRVEFKYDALGRRIEFIQNGPHSGFGTAPMTTRYYYDGANEVVEYNPSDIAQRGYVHGLSYIDERVMLYDCNGTTATTDDRPYYYVLDRMYNVRALVDRAGALVERYVYDPYGKPLIRESCGRGDCDDDTDMDSTDATRVAAVIAWSVWDPRADLDDDGDVDSADQTAYTTKSALWPPASTALTVAQAFSDVDNPYMFQGVPHFAMDTAANATAPVVWLNQHRERFVPSTAAWLTRDPLGYVDGMNLYEYLLSNPLIWWDPEGGDVKGGGIDDLIEDAGIKPPWQKKMCEQVNKATGIVLTT